MQNNSKNLKDLIDLNLWKKVQDKFSEITKTTICTIDDQGNEILVSGKLPYFCQILRKDKNNICNCSKEALNQIQDKKDKVLLYKCKTGLTNIWTPIIIDEKFAGAVGCVSLVEESKDISKLKEIKTDIDYDELADALNEIKLNKKEEIKNYSSMLYILSKTLPEIAKQRQDDSKKISELTTLHNITGIINSTLDINEILKNIIKFMTDSLKAGNCSIILFDDNNLKKYFYKKFNDIDLIEKVIIDEIKNTKSMVRIFNIKNDYRLKIDFIHNSVISFPLKIKKNIMGAINLYYNNEKELSEKIKDENIEFVSIIADQTAMAVLNAQQFDKAKESSIIDNLTGLYNRRYFMDILKRDLIRSIEHRNPLSLAMIDIDDFKIYNDTYGHIKGDEIIGQVSEIIKNNVRQIDVVGRYGGEEFIVIFPETENKTAAGVMENIRKAIEQKDFKGEEKLPNKKITISTGLVTCMDKTLTEDEIINIADKLLYKAKSSGKNKIMSNVIVDKNLKIDVHEVDEFYRKRKN